MAINFENSKIRKMKNKTLTIIFIFLLLSKAFAQTAGILDPDFNGNGKLTFSLSTDDDFCKDIAIDANQKIIAGGTSYMNGIRCFAITRLNPDGSFDLSFSTDGKQKTIINNADASLSKILIQSDQKIIAAGSNDNGIVLVRYNTDGTLDNSFSFDGIVTTSTTSTFGSAALDANGNIFVALSNGILDTTIELYKYDPNGALDLSFGVAGKRKITISYDAQPGQLIIDNDGTMHVFGSYLQTSVRYIFYTRLLSDGNYDTNVLGTSKYKTVGFTQSSQFASAAKNPDNTFYVAAITNLKLGITKLGTNGAVIGQFGNSGRVETDLGYKSAKAGGIVVQPDGKFFIGGAAVSQNFEQSFWVARFWPSGVIDSSFGINGLTNVSLGTNINDVAYQGTCILQPDYRFLMSGSYEKNNKADFVITRLLTGITTSLISKNTDKSFKAFFGNNGNLNVVATENTLMKLLTLDGREIGSFYVYPGINTFTYPDIVYGVYLLTDNRHVLKLLRIP
jgi:uncharacterized delta-60 repeat protein